MSVVTPNMPFMATWQLVIDFATIGKYRICHSWQMLEVAGFRSIKSSQICHFWQLVIRFAKTGRLKLPNWHSLGVAKDGMATSPKVATFGNF